VQSILVVKLGALGDVLLAEGALRDIRGHHPGAKLSLLTRRGFAPLLARCPWVDQVLVDENRPRWRLDAMWRLARMLRGAGFERAYDLQNSRRSRFYLGRLWRGCWSGDGPGCPLPHPHPAPKSLPVLERHAGQLAAAGISVRHTPMPGADWLCAPVDDLLANPVLAGRPYVVLLPGSSARGAGKRWPHYAELAARLLAGGLVPLTVPGPAEGDAFDALPGLCLREADGRALDLYRLAGVLRRAHAVVGNDSGPTHLAASLGRPGLALFGCERQQAARTCLARGRLQLLAAPGFAGLDAGAVEATLLRCLSG
jgi:ADP-heptose:LPS heptosyltransferase